MGTLTKSSERPVSRLHLIIIPTKRDESSEHEARRGGRRRAGVRGHGPRGGEEDSELPLHLLRQRQHIHQGAPAGGRRGHDPGSGSSHEGQRRQQKEQRKGKPSTKKGSRTDIRIEEFVRNPA